MWTTLDINLWPPHARGHTFPSHMHTYTTMHTQTCAPITCTHTHTYCLSPLSHTPSLYLSPSLIHIHTHITHTQTQHSLTHTHPHTLTHSHTFSYTHTLTLPFSPSLALPLTSAEMESHVSPPYLGVPFQTNSLPLKYFFIYSLAISYTYTTYPPLDTFLKLTFLKLRMMEGKQ